LAPDDPRETGEAGDVDSGRRDEQLAEQAVAEGDEEAAAEQARESADEPAAAPSDDEAPPTALSEAAKELLARLEAELGDAVLEHASAFGDLVVRVRPDSWRRAGEVARDALECDYLSFVSGIDWMPRPPAGDAEEEAGGDTSAPVQPTEMTYGAAGAAGRFQVFARVASTSRHHGVTLKSDVDESEPTVQSWVTVYPGADWHERETWEMYGFVFDGHPSLRHLYLPTDFEGHPLRKDFPLLAREVKPWPGLVDVEDMPQEPEAEPEPALVAAAPDATSDAPSETPSEAPPDAPAEDAS
jgi:NADH-quinone oxidoreductase subunit C